MSGFSIGLTSAALTAVTLDYTAPTDPVDGGDGRWEDAVSNGSDFILDSGVTYNGSPVGAPSGVPALYSFSGVGGNTTNRAAWVSGNNMENIGGGNPTPQSVTFEIVFRADTDTRQEILWEFGGSGRGASMTLNQGVLQFSEMNTALTISAPVSANVFYHAVGTLDFSGDLMSLYLNGASPVTMSYTGTDWAGNDGGTDGALGGRQGSTVGGQTNGNGLGSYTNFDGDIASFRMWSDQVATQADVDTLFAATGIIPEPSTVGLTLLAGLGFVRRRR